MKLYCFNTVIAPRQGVFDIDVDDDDKVCDILRRIWDEFRVTLQDRWPKVTRAHLELVRLTEPLPLKPQATLRDRMSEYDDAKKEPLELSDVISDFLDLTMQGHVLVELRVFPPTNRDPDKARTMVHRNNLLTIEAVRNSPPPSIVAGSVSQFKIEQDRYILCNGRPMNQSAAPVTIYHEAFARLKENLKKINRGESVGDQYCDFVAQTGGLFLNSCQIYDSERSREEAVMKQLGDILGVRWELRNVDDGKKVALVDGIARVEMSDAVFQQSPIVACVELKNELGLNGICEIQVTATYEKAVAREEYAQIRDVSCCPCLLISFAGPYICFYGAVLTDVFIVQPFTDYIFLGGDPDAGERIERVAKIFVEVRRALDELRLWYQSLRVGGGNPEVPSHILPQPTYARESDRALLSTLQFLDRFNYPGCRHRRPGRRSVGDFQRSLFHARLNGAEVLVKFCFQYGEQAHRVLAEHDPPLAPRLHACVPLVGGVTMVVMDIVPGGKTAWEESRKGSLPDSLIDDIETALHVLGREGLVHGDVRSPNVVLADRADGKTGGMLIDFDWAGKDGEVRYPSLLNKSVEWQQGVEDGKPIRSEHDWEMWRALKRGKL
ncbi:hypothetical protein BD414DRAFT_218607 [Trametes punicea]|nr:hypothetical protein BD414DRAFT_218607 [Trametes punicea]